MLGDRGSDRVAAAGQNQSEFDASVNKSFASFGNLKAVGFVGGQAGVGNIGDFHENDWCLVCVRL